MILQPEFCPTTATVANNSEILSCVSGRRSDCEKTISEGVFEQLLHAEVHDTQGKF